MLLDALKNDFLQARDQRQQRLDEVIAYSDNVLIQVSLSIPGPDKSPLQGDDLLRWADEQIRLSCSTVMQLYQDTDLLGPWAIYMTAQPAVETKIRCCEIESYAPFSRLLDLDVFSSTGESIGRQQLNFEPRTCLVCQEDARECMRTGRHDWKDIHAATERLLSTVPK